MVIGCKLSMVINGYQWLSVCLWLSMVIGYQWLLRVINVYSGYLCLLVTIKYHLLSRVINGYQLVISGYQ